MRLPIENAQVRMSCKRGKHSTYVITIPAAYIKNGLIKPGQTVNVTIEPKLNIKETNILQSLLHGEFLGT